MTTNAYLLSPIKLCPSSHSTSPSTLHELTPRLPSSSAAGALDIFSNAYFSVLFAYPLFKNQLSNARVKRLAIKSLIAAAASAIASSANLFTLSILSHGEQLSWECFAICTMDTLFNASVLFFVSPFLSDFFSSPSRRHRLTPLTRHPPPSSDHQH